MTETLDDWTEEQQQQAAGECRAKVTGKMRICECDDR